jgi:3-hydroxybutyryl-CoA dehydrogenase
MAEQESRRIDRVAVVGAGTMGRQIAALVAARGRAVAIHDALPEMLAAAPDRIREELATLPQAPRYAHHRFRREPSADHDALLARIRPAATLAEAVAGADLVIEAIREDLATKRAFFAEVDALLPDAILATNSSSIPSGQIASALMDPGRLLNMHFFAPIWQRAMVELMGCGQTRPEVMAAAEAFARSLGIVVAVVRGESKGFIINRVWRAVKAEALQVVDEGHADPEDVDRLWMIFFGTPMGPFGIMDMVGLDVVADIETSYQAVATDPADTPSATLHGKVAAGDLGEKSGCGFYRHPDPEYLQEGWLTGTSGEMQERPGQPGQRS